MAPAEPAGHARCAVAAAIDGTGWSSFSARKRGKTIGGAGVADDDMLSLALHLRDQEMSLRDISKRLVITIGVKKGQHPSPATVMRMLREHDEQAARAVSK
jgi:hypothetical protein